MNDYNKTCVDFNKHGASRPAPVIGVCVKWGSACVFVTVYLRNVRVYDDVCKMAITEIVDLYFMVCTSMFAEVV
jgi:hypothetical protein